jgi:hypothetical protein
MLGQLLDREQNGWPGVLTRDRTEFGEEAFPLQLIGHKFIVGNWYRSKKVPILWTDLAYLCAFVSTYVDSFPYVFRSFRLADST